MASHSLDLVKVKSNSSLADVHQKILSLRPSNKKEHNLVGRMSVSWTLSGAWRISNLNEDYQICPTYPSTFATPSTITDTVLKHAARFRAKGRLPILSWAHLHNNTSIFRSSQALVGLQRNRSIQDERLIEAIRVACPSKELLIVDASL